LLIRRFDDLEDEIEERQADLERKNRELLESKKLAAIGTLAAGVAHELNNPLQVMLGYLSLNRDVSDGPLREQLAAVEDETLRCKAIVDGMIELARPAATTAAAVNLRDLCDDVSSKLRASARGTSRLLVEGTAVAMAERPRIRQIVFNLVKNAVEATGPEGEVRVVIGTSGETAEVAVSDGGPGIAPEARARLFEPFFTTKPAGTGLGLAVSRAIARSHGGDIEVRTGDPGGAVFTLRLPRAPEART
jgi:two-component system NtrC family sensor kinase